MSDPRRPDLERLYHRYLETENTAGFIQAVSRTYLLSTLERLAWGGRHVSRRAAIMALGFLGDFSQNAALENFQRALALNPDLEDVKGQIESIQRALEGK